MRLAANHFLGEHDFVALQGQGSPRRNTVRNISRLDILVEPTWEGKLLQIDVTANGFLYNMVRNIVGTLVEVGHRKREPAWIVELLASGDRCLAGQTAPAQGLFLAEVYYE
jgi:tRNA pseudouridine38-40 synthase